MRPFTEGLLRGNSESLTQKGWKPDEQRRCFKKADALLDYIAKIKPTEYIRKGYGKSLNPQRVEGLKYCLEKDMPSKKMQKLSLDIVLTLLSMGDELLEKAAWIYKHFPVLFKDKYASSEQAFQKDIHRCFMKAHIVPENSFESFKTGQNPILSRNDSFSERCANLYMDSVFESSEYQAHRKKRESKDPYVFWIRKCKAGRTYIDSKGALYRAVEQLVMAKEIEQKVDKALSKQLLRKEQKTLT